MVHSVTLNINGKDLIIETGKLARQANGSVTISYGGTVVLTTVCIAPKANLNMDYFPLQVNYSEKYYAVGKIPGGFIKREGRAKDKEILVSRLIDRPIRPLFPEGFRNEVQVLPTTISADQVNPPDILGIISASAALCISDLPFNGPVGAVRVGLINGKLTINPTFEEIGESELDLIVAGTKNAITMIEGSAKELTEDQMLDALRFAHDNIIEVCKIQEDLASKCAKDKIEVTLFTIDDDIKKEVTEFIYEPIKNAFKSSAKKLEMYDSLNKIKEEAEQTFSSKFGEDKIQQIRQVFEEVEHGIVRRMIIDEDLRVDSRKLNEIRPISCDIEILPRTHGSALFTRGETQSLAIVTLGTHTDVQRFDDLDGESSKHFMLHYNFPPFSVGEVGRVGGVGRREIGHGYLAEKALVNVLPDEESFPYTIRVVSEILESNGSSSMASVCSSSMALLDAGVPISKAVSGIAMGLVTLDDKYKILTDIQGIEDHLGDMDFKVAGTRDGITAFQLDLKMEGISFDIMIDAFEQAKTARFEILDAMENTIKEVSETLSHYAPKIISYTVKENKIKDVIGPGGKTIKGIIEKTGANINVDDFGKVTISSKDELAAESAYNMVKDIITDAEIGKIYDGTVKRIVDFGAFIEILPGKEGLCHISKISRDRVNKVEDVLSVGKSVKVKVIEVDRQNRIKLSIKDADRANEGRR